MAANLVFEGVSKRFGASLALDALSLELRAGEILGFLGPNGAGKTTAIQIALGFLRPSAGSGSLLGRVFGDPSARQRVGFTPDAPVFFAGGAEDALRFAGRLNGYKPDRARVSATLEQVGLAGVRGDVRKFSRGMLQRLGLAQAIIHDPEVLILDEPASALDPNGVIEVRTLLGRLRGEGKSIFFSSHQLTEVERVCDRVAFLRTGRLLHQGSLRELLGAAGRVQVTVRGLPETGELLARQRAVEAPTEREGDVRWVLPVSEVRPAIEATWAAGGTLVSVREAQASLGDLFAQWTSDGGSAAGAAE